MSTIEKIPSQICCVPVHGECGGFMVLGECLTDAEGMRHAMAALLPVETSFADPRLTLGYREAELIAACALGEPGARLRGHEFHFASLVAAGDARALMRCRDARGTDLGVCGAVRGAVSGAFFHASSAIVLKTAPLSSTATILSFCST